MSLRAVLPPGLKRRLRPIYHRGRRHLIRSFRSYDAADLQASLADMGIETGTCLFVHGGFDGFTGFDGTAADCIETLLATVGADGHLMMVSMAYRGSSEAYARLGQEFDELKTPSAMGMLSEVFRRREDVRRSASPLHPVLACGPKARWLVADHDKLACSCGPGSPFERFLALDGKVLFLDAAFGTLTFMHYLEHRHRNRFPFPLYADEALPIAIRDRRGRTRSVTQRLFSEAVRARRTFDHVERELRDHGRIQRRRLGNSTLLVVSARDVVECTDRVVEHGRGLFD